MRFGTGDRRSPTCRGLPRANVVAAQSGWEGLAPDEAAAAIDNLAAQTAAGGVLCLGNADPDVLVKAVRRHRLEPILYRLEEIHEGWRPQPGRDGAPSDPGPVDRSRDGWEIRYCTLFRTPDEA